MAKYAGTTKKTSRSALKTTDERTLTHEGAPAYAKDARTELFTLAVTSMTAEDTFYESAYQRDSRLRGLVQQLTAEDPGFVQRLVPWLRNTANMRSAPIVIAAEYALANGPHRRRVIDSAMARADEPAEFIGYYMKVTGRKTLPAGIQRGVADAVQRLYNEWSALKYDSGYHDLRMGDVIELVHPRSENNQQGELYQWLLDRRHNPSNVRANITKLPVIQSRANIEAVEIEQRREVLRAVSGNSPLASPEVVDMAKEAFAIAGITWEYLSGWLPGGMDAEAWESVVPHMGYMALLRNLRNFDEAGISDEARAHVKTILENPDNVAASRQFPYRFWSAWNATQSVEWGSTLEKALKLSCQNIPDFDGTTIVFVDVSGSMDQTVSEKSKVRNCDVAALFGAAAFERNPKTTRVVKFGTYSKEVTPGQRGSILRHMENFRGNDGVGHATYLSRAVDDHYRDEDRVVVFTDEQTHDGGASGRAKFTHYFDLAGYRSSPDKIGVDGTFMYGGFTDATFRQMKLNELIRTSDWDSILSQ
jgi:hypothetical protein